MQRKKTYRDNKPENNIFTESAKISSLSDSNFTFLKQPIDLLSVQT